MRIALQLFELLLPALYFWTVWAYGRSFFSGIKRADEIKGPLLFSTLLTHTIYIGLRALAYDHPPITSVFEIFSLIAFTVTLSYAYIEFRTKNRTTGYFILVLPFFFQTISSIFIRETTSIPPMLHSTLLGIHVSSALLGMAAITLSAVYGMLYLMLYHDLKSSQFGVIYKRLPNLEVLERMSFNSTKFGFVLLTIAIGIGMVWLPRAVPNFSYTDPKLFGTMAVWLIYGAGFGARTLAGWQGRRIIVFSLIGFVLSIFSMTIINILFTGFHKFY